MTGLLQLGSGKSSSKFRSGVLYAPLPRPRRFQVFRRGAEIRFWAHPIDRYRTPLAFLQPSPSDVAVVPSQLLFGIQRPLGKAAVSEVEVSRRWDGWQKEEAARLALADDLNV